MKAESDLGFLALGETCTMFSAVQFTDAVREFQAPDLSEFEFFNESMDVTIHRKYNPVSVPGE